MLKNHWNTFKICLFDQPWTQDVNWTYIRRSEDVLDFFWTSYVRLIYVLCPGGEQTLSKVLIILKKTSSFEESSCWPKLLIMKVYRGKSILDFSANEISKVNNTYHISSNKNCDSNKRWPLTSAGPLALRSE